MNDLQLNQHTIHRPAPQYPQKTVQSNTSEYTKGQLVSLKSDPNKRGVIVNIIRGKAVKRYEIFLDNTIQSFYASQLRADVSITPQKKQLSAEQFHAFLSALHIRNPSTMFLHSLNAARVDYIPYQFKPVLRFIRSDRPRMLIADSVGVGKTIEAGYILRELQARNDIEKVLIICPRPLVSEKKWEGEMKRFDEQFKALNGETLRYCLSQSELYGEWPSEYSKIIVPYSLFDEALLLGSTSKSKNRKKRGLIALDPPPRFDLVIVDEAHHIRNPKTYRHKGVRFFCDNAEAAVFLTATPIQLGNRDLYTLLHILRPDLVQDYETFKRMAEPNPFINSAIDHMRSQKSNWNSEALAALNEAASTAWGGVLLKETPQFKNISSILQKPAITDHERVKIISETEGLHSFASFLNRTRRRDIGDFTVRKPETINIPFNDSQQEFHDTLIRIQTHIFQNMHNSSNIAFMLTTIRRQAASCLFGLVPLLENILYRHIHELAWEDYDSEFSPDSLPNEKAFSSIQTQIEELLEAAKTLNTQDPKLDALKKIIKDKQALNNNKIMIFSSFRHSLHYLYDKLSMGDYRVGMIHGGTPDEERLELRRRFEDPREQIHSLDMLLFSEVGSEGLDYQFCDCIVNYDLPWNPMRIEQRIGRIDRNGQQSESVVIYNLITPGTVDADIYERCMLRIGVFNRSLGAGEEILGDISREIHRIAENFELNEEERRAKFQQLADNKIRRIQAEAELEKQQNEFFALSAVQNSTEEEIEQARNYALSAAFLENLITQYIQQTCNSTQEFILGKNTDKTLRLSQEHRSILLQHYKLLPRKITPYYRQWENWLKGSEAYLPISFDAEFTKNNPRVAFIMPLHPLVMQAAKNIENSEIDIIQLLSQTNKIAAGSYTFAVYSWQYEGIKRNFELKFIAQDPALQPCLEELLKNASSFNGQSEANNLDDSSRGELEAIQHNAWKQSQKTHKQEERDLALYRLDSLETSHNARLAQLNEQLETAQNINIQAMRKSQIRTATEQFQKQKKQLQYADKHADILTKPVCYGILHIENIKN